MTGSQTDRTPSALSEDPVSSNLKRMSLRYAGRCVACGSALASGVQAFYDPATKTVHCLECPTATNGPSSFSHATPASFDAGVAGASAEREFERRKASDERRVKSRFGKRLGGFIYALSEEPQSTRAWAQGAEGEQRLAKSLAKVKGIRVLHDRRVPGTAGNIDHLVVGSAGVFVVDAKLYSGLIEIRDIGGFFKTDKRLYVGRRDCSKLAENMTWQVDAVESALDAASVDLTVPVVPVLCFVNGEWPWFRPPNEYAGVRLESEDSLRDLVVTKGALDSQAIERLRDTLARALPSK